MHKVRNVSGQSLYVPAIGDVDDGEVFEVPEEKVYAYTASANFEPVGEETAAVHDAAAEAEAAAVEAEVQAARAAGMHDNSGQAGGAYDPAASVKDTLRYVGNRPARAAEVLAVEQAAEKPRPSLIEALQKILGGA